MRRRRNNSTLGGVLLIIVVIVAYFLFRQPNTSTPGTTPGNTPTTASSTTHFGVQTKTSGCQAHDALPDSACTPGAILSTGTKDAICVSGYARIVRNVPESEKIQAYQEYGISHHSPGAFEIDHLISLELGGSNDIANLWPESADAILLAGTALAVIAIVTHARMRPVMTRTTSSSASS